MKMKFNVLTFIILVLVLCLQVMTIANADNSLTEPTQEPSVGLII